MAKTYIIQRLPINNTTWTPIQVPATCKIYSIRCDTDAVFVRTNQSDASTQDSIALGETVYVSPTEASWGTGDTICWLMSETQANATVVIYFLG